MVTLHPDANSNHDVIHSQGLIHARGARRRVQRHVKRMICKVISSTPEVMMSSLLVSNETAHS
jgi:hypothetical protein